MNMKVRARRRRMGSNFGSSKPFLNGVLNIKSRITV
jgi:hypothetical protein